MNERHLQPSWTSICIKTVWAIVLYIWGIAKYFWSLPFHTVKVFCYQFVNLYLHFGCYYDNRSNDRSHIYVNIEQNKQGKGTATCSNLKCPVVPKRGATWFTVLGSWLLLEECSMNLIDCYTSCFMLIICLILQAYNVIRHIIIFQFTDYIVSCKLNYNYMPATSGSYSLPLK